MDEKEQGNATDSWTPKLHEQFLSAHSMGENGAEGKGQNGQEKNSSSAIYYLWVSDLEKLLSLWAPVFSPIIEKY